MISINPLISLLLMVATVSQQDYEGLDVNWILEGPLIGAGFGRADVHALTYHTDNI